MASAISFHRTIQRLYRCRDTSHPFISKRRLSMRQSCSSYGVYVHIPFCRRRCFYCDFSIKVIGERESTRNIQSELYTELLLKDMVQSHRININSQSNISALDTVYFGGGTPSLMTDDCIARIINQLHNLYGIATDAEITLEMDPGTFTLNRLHNLHKIGINRVSMGVQSFNDELLKACGRAHTVHDIHIALDSLHNSPIDNFSIDLISSLPHMTLKIWIDTLHEAAASHCTHVSVYDLQIEEKTAFGRWYTPGEFPLPTEEIAAEMYKYGVQVLTNAGFDHYEVSNYAREGKWSRHNQKYWNCNPVLAFGISAASYVHGERFTRPRLMEEYIEFVNKLSEMEPKDDIIEDVNPDPLDVVMLSLRTADGLSLNKFQQEYGHDYTMKLLNSLQNHYETGNVILLHDKNRSDGAVDEWTQIIDGLNTSNNSDFQATSIRLSDPEGFLLSNEIISDVFAAIG